MRKMLKIFAIALCAMMAMVAFAACAGDSKSFTEAEWNDVFDKLAAEDSNFTATVTSGTNILVSKKSGYKVQVDLAQKFTDKVDGVYYLYTKRDTTWVKSVATEAEYKSIFHYGISTVMAGTDNFKFSLFSSTAENEYTRVMEMETPDGGKVSHKITVVFDGKKLKKIILGEGNSVATTELSDVGSTVVTLPEVIQE